MSKQQAASSSTLYSEIGKKADEIAFHYFTSQKKFTSILITSLFLIYHHTNLIKIANSNLEDRLQDEKKMFLSSSLFFIIIKLKINLCYFLKEKTEG